jgi:hypothetical protein
MRFARFAQAMRSTNADAPRSTRNGVPDSARSSSISRVAAVDQPRYSAGCPAATCLPNVSISARACASDVPGASRATTLIERSSRAADTSADPIGAQSFANSG